MKGSTPNLGHVFLASVSILSYEILLTRIFAVSQWNQLVFMVISIALFGLAASGTLLSLLSAGQGYRLKHICNHRWPSAVCSLQALVTIGSYAGLNALPLDYYRLSLEPVQLAYLLAGYLMLALPFLAAGLVIGGAYAAQPHRSGSIYCATMTGSACGAVLPVPLIPMIEEPVLVVMTALLPLCIQPLYLMEIGSRSRNARGQRRRSFLLILLGMVAVVLAAWLTSPFGSPYLSIRSSEYKGFDQALRFPDTTVAESHRSPRGHVDRVQGPYLRYAPGLSLNYPGRLPSQQVIFSDRDIPLTLYAFKPDDLTFARATLSYVAYRHVPAAARVLVIPQNGGLSLACALASGATDVQVVIPHPQLARMVQNHYGLTVSTDHPRAFVARSPGGFDIIHIENWGSTIPGADALTQNHSLTVDAFEACLKRLTSNGVLTISRRLMLPPSDSLRLWATAHEALVRTGSRNPLDHIAMLRNWGTYTLVIARRPLSDTSRLLAFARRHSFDIVYLNGTPAQIANRFNELPEPYYFNQIARLAKAYQNGQSGQLLRQYPLDVAPQTDLRPFPGRFLKWTKIRTLYKSIGRRFYSLFLSGEVVVMVVLAEALLVTLLLLILPRWMMRERHVSPTTRLSLYFFGIGCGFMFLEIYAIHLYSFLLGDPLIGFSTVAAGLLVFSGLGGLVAQIGSLRTVRIVLAALTVVIAVLGTGQLWGLDWMLALPPRLRFMLALVMLLPFGLLIGVPFPLGMRFMAVSPAARAYAWSVNGCASVLSAILAAQLAISYGMAYLLIGAMAAYAISLMIGSGYFRSEPMVDNTANRGN